MVNSKTYTRAQKHPEKTTLVLLGHCPAKKSLYRSRQGGGMRLDAAVKADLDWLTLQAKLQWNHRPAVEHPALTFTFHMRSAAADVDGKQVSILDCLQRAGVISNDNARYNNGRKIVNPAVIDSVEFVEIEVLTTPSA